MLALLPGISTADNLVVSCCAWHEQAGNNNRNLGLGYEHVVTDNVSYVVGFYENSFFRNTDYAGVKYQPYRALGLKWGVVAGFATGYGSGLLGGQPEVLPMASYEGKLVGVNFMFIPIPGSAEVGIQLKLKVF